MRIPLSSAFYEFTEKKSRFLAQASPAVTPDEARQAVKEIRKAHPACRHAVHAFVLGSRGEIQGMSDDGEPAGTAGKPVLEMLKGRDITNVVITVVRYFGGIKLGTGGLVRAYGQAARGVLDLLPVEELIRRREFAVRCSYGLYEGIKKRIQEAGGEIFYEDFTQDVTMEGRIPDEKAEGAELAVRDFSAGAAELVFRDGSPNRG